MEALSKLGIDGWGLLLYLANFGLLLWLLKRLAYKPLLAMIEERRKRITEDVERASELRSSLELKAAKEEEERKARLLNLDERVKQAKSTARDEAKRMMSDAESHRDAILSAAAKTADATIAATLEDAEQEILLRVKRVVTHVLEEGVPKELVDASVKKSFESFKKAA